MKRISSLIALLVLLLTSGAWAAPAEKGATKTDKDKKASSDAKKDEKKDPWNPGTFTGLSLRGIGPAMTSGRIGDLAIHPREPNTWYVAVASGGVWKTINAGTTWAPIFDGQASYSIGCVTIDPNDPLVVWVGTGENNSQRSVAYGDGVYKSTDGGKSWNNVGLKTSEHIGKIVVDPRNSDVVYVAAQGPLWAAGGDRGLYKTTDGGKTWKAVLAISENTGVSDLVMDPRNPDVLYASSYQRRRHVWTLINGGPESAIHKSRRRRRHLEEAGERPAQGGDGAHRPRHRTGQPRRGLRGHRGGARCRRLLPLHGRRRKLGEAERLRRGQPAVLPGALRRSHGRRHASTPSTSSSR